MDSIKYKGKYKDEERIFEYCEGKWHILKGDERTELHNVAFFEPSWGVIQLDSLKERTITLEDFMKGIDPSDATGEKGQLYYLTKPKERLARTGELTKITNNNNSDEETFKITELDE